MNLLDQIFAHKRHEVTAARQKIPLSQMRHAAETASPPLDFVAALRQAKAQHNWPALIAEIKRASPSKGILRAELDASQMACVYAENGAAALSILTDSTYFYGSLDDLQQVDALDLPSPILRKDFLYDEYQVYETRAAGADAILLIATYLPVETLRHLHALALHLGMTPLVEVHSLEDVQRALACQPVAIGINHRNLRDFTVSQQVFFDLRPYLPESVCIVAESGIRSEQDIYPLMEAGVDAILVGEALVRAPDVAALVRRLAGVATV